VGKSLSVSRTFVWSRVQVVVVLAVVVLCVVLRLLPEMLLNAPYLPDPWVHIAKGDAILQSGHFNIWGDYDDHWPGVNILVALFALFPGVDSITTARAVVPLLCSLSLIAFYLLMRRLTGNGLVALVGLTLVGFAAPLTLIMGTTFKEGLARLLLSLALLAFVARSSRRFEPVVLVVLFVSAIILVHHLAFLIAAAVIVFVVISVLAFERHTGQLPLRSWLLLNLGYLSVLALGLAYFIAFGCFAILLLDARLAAIGVVVFLAVFGVLNLGRTFMQKTTPRILRLLVLAVGVVLLVILLANFASVPSFPLTLLPPQTLALLLPLAATVALGGAGLSIVDRLASHQRIFLSSWAFALLGLLFLAIFAVQAPLNIVLTYRFFLFVLEPLCGLAGICVVAYGATSRWRSRTVQGLLVIGLLAVLPVTTLAFTRDPFFGYGCSITPPIQASNQWLALHAEPGAVIASDHLGTYYLLYYLNREASVDAGQRLFVDGDVGAPFTFAVRHRYMEENGFWLASGVQWAPVDRAVLSWLASHAENALVFNNGVVQVYRRLSG
jgi:hypothetical protein